MEKKIVGKVTIAEKNEILALFERRNGLNELAKILTADNSNLYEKLVKDMGITETKFQQWWNNMAQKYQWESAEGCNWEINFDTCEIMLSNSSFANLP
ncbi:MAG: CXXX repeat peptide modification system protein [Prevotellaceae bacterium]|nr:CXXX repeat peptide modification system protein [Candidatus Faecinaster equi]